MTTAESLLISLAIGCGFISHAAAATDIVSPGSKVELVARTQAAQATPFTEGPVYRDGYVYFTDTSNSRILRVAVDRQAALPVSLEIFRKPSRRANGLEFDSAGRLLACEGSGTGGGRRVTRTESSGALTVLAEKYQGKRLNSPNDLTVGCTRQDLFHRSSLWQPGRH
jgi:gluconolactonase